MGWFKRWFGEEYLLVYEHRDIKEAKKEIESIASILKFGKNELILDLCCGSGRHDCFLAEMGCRIIGLDYSEQMIEIAHTCKSPDMTFPLYVRGDARLIPFRDITFDTVLNLFTSFGYFSDEENSELINSIARLLKPGGRYFIDYLNPQYVISTLVEKSTREKDGMEITEKRRIDHTAKRIEKTIVLRKNGDSRTYFESVRLYESQEMIDMLERAGLDNAAILGSVDGDSYDGASPRMIFHGIKG